MKTNFKPILQFDPLTVAAITAGAQLLGTGANAVSTGRMNKKNRQFSEHMYDRQRQDSLADWNMVNEYNSPEAQMRRYKEAGLNPNLIYGQSNESQAVRSSSFSEPNTQAPHIDLSGIGDAVNQYYNVKTVEQQLKNAKAEENLTNARVLNELLKPEQTVQNIQESKSREELNKFNLSLDSELRPLTVQTKVAMLKQIYVNTDATYDANKRAEQIQPYAIKEKALYINKMRIENAKTLEEIQNLIVQRNNIKSSTELNNLEAELRKKGSSFHDPLWQRQTMELLNNLGLFKKPEDRNSVEKFFFGNGTYKW